MSAITPAAPMPPKPHLTLAELEEQIQELLGQAQLHAAHALDGGALRKLVLAGTHLAYASVLVRQAAQRNGPDVSALQALHGLQALIRDTEGAQP